MVLGIFDAPVLASQWQRALWSSLLHRQAADRKSDFVGFFVDFAPAHMLDVAMDANDLGGTR